MKSKFTKYLLASLIISPVALIVGIVSTGFGHGDYFYTKILFPYTMLSIHLTKGVIPYTAAVFALFQFPIYGLLTGLASLKRKDIYVLVIIILLHITAAYLCFYWPLPT